MRNPTLLLSFLLLTQACTSDRRPPLALLPASPQIEGATGILTARNKAQLIITTRDLNARLDLEKSVPDVQFFRLELVVLDADQQPLPGVPVLNVVPSDLEKLNSRRIGQFSLRFRADAPANENTLIGESRRQRRNRNNSTSGPAWSSNAHYFLLRAEVDHTAQAGGDQPGLLESKSAPTVSDRPKTIPEIVAITERAVFLVYAFDEAGNALKQGSGFFIDPSGIGVSNYHVFEGGKQWAIQTTDKRQYRVSEILQSSKEYDHVVFRVEASTPFPYLKTAPGKALKGEEILVIGNPRGLESTVTQGIVSALRDPMIQIDAAVSPGNSGGPVLNRQGEVLGIATQKILDCENCNFAFDIRVLDYRK